jgi:DNA-binding SARP family transcriptional activator/TolB-like protein
VFSGAALGPIAYKLQLFGSPRLVTAAGDVLPAGKRARGILCYLALARDRKASRERLCNLFWWDRGTAQARASLRQALLELRSALPPGSPDPFCADREGVALDPRHVRTDIEAAEAAGSAAALLDVLREIGAEPAVDTPSFGDAFDEWRASMRPLVESRLRVALVGQLDAAEAGNDQDAIIALADAWALRDPLDEVVAARAIRAELLTDKRGAAERRYRQLSTLIEGEGRGQPDPGLLELFQTPASGDRAAMLIPALVATAASIPDQPVKLALAPPESAGGTRAARTWQYAAALFGLVLMGVAGSLALGLMRPLADPATPVVVVLPFRAEGGGADDAIFAEGLAEEVMTGLAQDGRIHVLGRATALRLAAAEALRDEAHERLGVTRLLTGTLQYGADRSRLEVKVELKDGRTGASEWARTVRLAATDVSSAEHELVNMVTRELLGETGRRQPSASRPARLDPGAYRRIVLARRHVLSREGDRLIEARELARQAVDIAPGWAEAHAVRSTAASLMQNYTDMPVEPLGVEARAAAAQALSLDARLPAAWEARSLALEGVDQTEAMAAAKRAVQLRPANAEARRRLAWLLRADGQHRQAAVELEAAIRIDPLWYLPYIDLGISLAHTNEPGKLIAWQARHAALDPPAAERDLVLANMLLDTGRAGEAAPIAARLVRTDPDFTYAALTWTDSLLALFAADVIPVDQFEFNSLPAMVALVRGDVAGAVAGAIREGPAVWDDAEAAVILGYALMAQGDAARLRALHMAHYPRPEDHSRRPAQALALNRHPGLYPALAYAAAGDVVGARAMRGKIALDVARLERLGLAMSQSGVTIAALELMDGDRSAAIDRLESSMAAQWTAVCHGPIWIGQDPLFGSLANEPRFTAVLERCRGHLNRQRAAAGLGPSPALKGRTG